jgi:cobaltochelatase CobN
MINFAYKKQKGGENMRKQTILLVTTIVFALLLCGAVSAEDLEGGDSQTLSVDVSQTSNSVTTTNTQDSNPNLGLESSKQNEIPDPMINGTVKEVYNGTASPYDPTPNYVNQTNAIPVNNATVTIKNPNDGSIIATTKTDVNGYYSVNFNSLLSNFIVEIVYSSYKTYIGNLTVGSSHEATLDHIFMPDIVILSSGSDKKYAINSLNNRRLLFVDMFDNSYSSNPVYNWMMNQVNFALTDMAMPGSGYGDWWYSSLLQSPAQANAKIAYAFGWPVSPPDALHILRYNGTNNVNSLENTYMGSYLIDVTSSLNMQNMVNYICYLLGETSVDPTTVGKGPDFGIADWGIYHPDYPTSNHICAVSAVTNDQIRAWIIADPGYLPYSGSLKWVDNEYAAYTATERENVYKTFENWYTTYKPSITGSFVAIASYYPGGVTVDALIREYEKQGRAVFNFYQGGTTPAMSQFLVELTTGSNGIGPLSRGVSAVNSLYAWSMNYNNIYNGGATSDFQKMNLAAIQAVQLTDPASLTNPLGAQYEWTMDVISPSMEGVFSPVALSYTDSSGTVHPIDSSIAKMVQLTIGWAKLKELANYDKKVAIILYDYPPGKDSIGASYLDVFQSVVNVLTEMKKEGYNVGSTIPTADQLYTIVAAFGNKGIWAQPLLDQYVQANYQNLTSNGQLLDVSKYLQWFNQLPAAMQQNVTAQWGSAPGNIMVSGGKIVIPGMMFGNVFLTVQPSRGWDAVEDYHNPYLPPTHQYIAFYDWLKNVFGANAMIHFGTHGTLEFLPGRTTALQETDWPFQLTSIPNINPYIVSNPGEGMTTKDRADALIIDHMTPAMVQSGLYGELYNLLSLLDQYNNAVKLGNTQVLPALLSEIVTKAAALGLPTQTQGQSDNDYLEVIHEKLDEISDCIIPLGLHTFGGVMSNDQLVQEVLTIASSRTQIMDDMKNVMYPALNGKSYYDLEKNAQQYSEVCNSISNQVLSYIKQLVNGTDPNYLGVSGALLADFILCNQTITNIRASGKSEMDSLMNALSGGYVPPGLGADPSYSDVLPTGKDFYASDTKKMPTKAAYETGKTIANQLLITYYNEHGKFPELIGLVMWGTELLRTDAIAIGEFLYLLGVTPTWDNYGNVNGVALIPLSDLTITINGTTMNRPRVDVFTTAVTGTQSWINLLNSAVALAAGATGETPEQNYLLKHLAENPSLDRVFGLPGNVLEGTGVSDLLPNTSKWNSTSDLASVYLSRMSNAWRSTDSSIQVSQNGNGVAIVKNQATFEYLLKNMDVAAQNLDSTWRLLDSDDYYDWYGGMLMTSKQLGGNPEGLVTDMRNQNNIVTRDYREELKLELNSQLLNPAYQNSLLGTASGWNEYSQRYADLFAFSATNPDSISQSTWTQVSQNLLDLSKSTGLSKDYQGFAMQSMLGWSIEAARRGMWQPSSQMLQDLVNTYITETIKYGPVCCHHTCGALSLNNFVVVSSSLSSQQLQEFASVMQAATGMSVTVGSTGTPTQQASAASATSASDSSSASSAGDQPATDSGAQSSSESVSAGTDASAKAYEVSHNSSSSSGPSNMPIVAIVGVLILVGLVGAGYFRANIVGFFKK